MNFHQAERLSSGQRPATTPGAALLLTAGGDERIRLDAATRRNRYATTATPRPGEIFLSSSTASTITPRAFRAVEAAWTALTTQSAGEHGRIDCWFDGLRTRLTALFGVAGAEVVLTASGRKLSSSRWRSPEAFFPVP